MDWFLYDNGLRHEWVNQNNSFDVTYTSLIVLENIEKIYT